MDTQKNTRVIFTNKADLVFSEIIGKYNLKETENEMLQALRESGHSRTSLIKKIIIAFAKGIISNNDLETSLAKVLKVDEETIKIISKDIIKNLVPLLEKFPDDKFNDPNFREEISKKIFGDIEKMPLLSSIKNISVTDVEKNAEQIQKTKQSTEEEKEMDKLGDNQFENEKKEPDAYREAID